MHRVVAALVVVVFVLAAVAGPAQAQFGGPNVPGGLTEPPPEPSARNFDDDDGGLSMLQFALIFGTAALVLGTIAWFILRDAHRVAPVGGKQGKKAKARKGGAGGSDGGRGTGSGGRTSSNGADSGSAPMSARSAANAERARERQKAKRAKAKAKAARQQRKLNRPR